LAAIAGIAACTRIAVVARDGIELGEAALLRIAMLVCADGVVIAERIHGNVLTTLALEARVCGARYLVVAIGRRSGGHAAGPGLLHAFQRPVAWVLVVELVAVLIRVADALLDGHLFSGQEVAGAHVVQALVTDRTRIAVVTLVAIEGCMLAPLLRIAGILRAGNAIIAGQRSAGLADPLGALVAVGANIAVVAGSLVVAPDALAFHALVVRARVVVVAVELLTRTVSLPAYIIMSAGIAVVARR